MPLKMKRKNLKYSECRSIETYALSPARQSHRRTELAQTEDWSNKE